MGESREGGGGRRSLTTSMIARAIADRLASEEREPEAINVRYLTEGIYSCQVFVRGEPEPEVWFEITPEQTRFLTPSPPTGGKKGTEKGS